jgi:RND family efflux transporter MFP subunit
MSRHGAPGFFAELDYRSAGRIVASQAGCTHNVISGVLVALSQFPVAYCLLITLTAPVLAQSSLIPASNWPTQDSAPAWPRQDEKANTTIAVQGAVLRTIESTSVPALLEGTLRSLNVQEGDLVKIDQLLCSLNDDAVRIQLQQKNAQLEIMRHKEASDINLRLARKARQVAENEYQRAVKANALVPDTYPLNEIDRLKLVADKSALEVERAEYERKLAALEVNIALAEFQQVEELARRHQIKAPVPGVVVAVEKRVGEWVQPGTELLRIVRIDRLRVEGFVAAEQAPLSLVGRPAAVKLPNTPAADAIQGRVMFVSPDVNTINTQVRIFIEVSNADARFRPGLPVVASVAAEESEARP